MLSGQTAAFANLNDSECEKCFGQLDVEVVGGAIAAAEPQFKKILGAALLNETGCTVVSEEYLREHTSYSSQTFVSVTNRAAVIVSVIDTVYVNVQLHIPV